jgi:response regulator RpfG family c-di-GMP phosphodiesterase
MSEHLTNARDAVDRVATVAVVDDEPMVTTALRAFLELETPYRVVCFGSPRAALDALVQTPVQVVIADFMMPEMDGIEFLRRVRECCPFATRILLTGYADKANAIRAINEVGLYYFLEKPWSNEQLELIVRNGVERSDLFSDLDARVSALEAANRDLTQMRQRLIRAFM